MAELDPGKVISTIIKHDHKVTSYKIALLRAINDVVLSFPDLESYHRDVAVPLRVLAEYWVAYYWPFVAPDQPIFQGPRSTKGLDKRLSQDMSFRPHLTALRQEWEKASGGLTPSRPADGFFLTNELRIPRKHQGYPPALRAIYHKTLSSISNTLEMPIRYAGPAGEEWSVFDQPRRLSELMANLTSQKVIAVPGTKPQDKCLLIKSELWQIFRQMSLWVEALCLHEWCLFTEKVEQLSQKSDPATPPLNSNILLSGSSQVSRGTVYQLLTDRPDNRRPLSWERNNIDLLILEGREFVCPWTEKKIRKGVAYDLDHLVPVSVYSINELWNLVPADPYFNSHVKRDRLPSLDRLARAETPIKLAYSLYDESKPLGHALREDVAAVFGFRSHHELSCGKIVPPLPSRGKSHRQAS